MNSRFWMRLCSGVAVLSLTLGAGAAPAPVVLKDVSAYGFPDFLSTLNESTKGWMFAPPFVGLKWVELNGVLLNGNSGTNDPENGLSFVGVPVERLGFAITPMPYAVTGFNWEKAAQRPARNGLCRGGIHGNRDAMTLKLSAPPGRDCILEILALGAFAQKRSMNVLVDGRTVATNWTVLADPAANRLLRLQVRADADGIDLQLTPGTVPGTDTNPAITAIALTDTTGGLWSHDPVFGRSPVGMVNIAPRGAATSPDGLEQDGDGRGDAAGIDGDPNTYWDEADGAGLYRYVVGFKEPESISELALMGWAQHEFAPKDFEVLCDGKVAQKVQGARYVNNVFRLSLDKTVCRTVELKIGGYYGRSPAIRELGLFSSAPRAAAAAPAEPAPPKDGGPIFAEWPLAYKGQRLAVYALGKFKPYVKELSPLQGRSVLRDAPFDHLHHHALMYGIRVNGVNFWEETAGCGSQKPVETRGWAEEKSADGHPRFVLRQRLHWLASEDAALADTAAVALLVEQRTLRLTVDESAREVALEWASEFQAGAKTNVVTLTGANYHGLGMRFRQDMDPLARHLNAGGAPDLGGNKQDVSKHKWASVSFASPTEPYTLALFGRPDNARGDSWFFTMRTPFAYLSATQNLDKEPLVYRAGETFRLRYLVTLRRGIEPAAALEARAVSWARSAP